VSFPDTGRAVHVTHCMWALMHVGTALSNRILPAKALRPALCCYSCLCVATIVVVGFDFWVWVQFKLYDSSWWEELCSHSVFYIPGVSLCSAALIQPCFLVNEQYFPLSQILTSVFPQNTMIKHSYILTQANVVHISALCLWFNDQAVKSYKANKINTKMLCHPQSRYLPLKNYILF
jgi:hypothetical protein